MNPYAASNGPFVGRQRELEKLERELLRGRSALVAVMAGRGMGKTSFARVLATRLYERAPSIEVIRWSRTPADVDEFLAKLTRELNFDFTGNLFDDELVEAISARSAARIILILDEVDDLISKNGRPLLENLRIAWEQLAGKLGLIVLGGSSLYELLETNVSPFLRNAEFICLNGLSHEEVRQLVTEPSGLQIDDDLLNLLWQDTAGHPALVTDIMKAAFDRRAEDILDVIDLGFVRALETKYFGVWWRNLRGEGQALYRSLLEHAGPVTRERVAALVAAPASNWVRVLETTGVAREERGELLPRGQMFATWVQREHFVDPRPQPPSAAHLDAISMSAFEREIIHAVGSWGRGIVEYAGLGLQLKSSEAQRGNARLLPEAHFQLSLLLALQQHGWAVEAEGWSVVGRSDLKIGNGDDQRSCVELKIWSRPGYKDATEQVVEYALPMDEFASVVMIDRQASPLLERYARLLGDKGHEIVAEAASASVTPQFVTLHGRSTGAPLRVHHFLVQLPTSRTG